MGLGTVLIRADASPEIGAGHVMRCLALAQEWRRQGGSVVFAMAGCTVPVRARLTSEDFAIVDVPLPAGSREDSEWMSQYNKKSQPCWIVLDGYRFGARYHRRMRDSGSSLLCVDDDGRCSEYGADLILNQNLTASRDMYEGQARSRVLMGPRYALLRSEFLRWRDWKRTIPPVAKSILVILGGSTPVDAARIVLEALVNVGIESMAVKCVIGGASPEWEQLTTANPAVTFVKDPAKLPELIAAADVAISATGSTCWELCFLGAPSLLIDVAPNQTPIARKLDLDACAVHAGSAQNLSAGDLSRQLRELSMLQERRQRLSERGRSLVDGRGAWRVVAAMRSEQMTFRRATGRDTEMLWAWANDPATREASLSSGIIGWEEHQSWLQQKLADRCSIVLVAEEAGDPIATVRLEKKDARARMSLTLAPAARGFGLSTKLIEEGVRQAACILRALEVEAVVKSWNRASRRAFENAGFREALWPQASGSGLIHYVRETSAEAAPEFTFASERRA